MSFNLVTIGKHCKFNSLHRLQTCQSLKHQHVFLTPTTFSAYIDSESYKSIFHRVVEWSMRSHVRHDSAAFKKVRAIFSVYSSVGVHELKLNAMSA